VRRSRLVQTASQYRRTERRTKRTWLSQKASREGKTCSGGHELETRTLTTARDSPGQTQSGAHRPDGKQDLSCNQAKHAGMLVCWLSAGYLPVICWLFAHSYLQWLAHFLKRRVQSEHAPGMHHLKHMPLPVLAPWWAPRSRGELGVVNTLAEPGVVLELAPRAREENTPAGAGRLDQERAGRDRIRGEGALP
jgi:hypothetical protein